MDIVSHLITKGLTFAQNKIQNITVFRDTFGDEMWEKIVLVGIGAISGWVTDIISFLIITSIIRYLKNKVCSAFFS